MGKRTHGLSRHPMYNTWCSMMTRCYNKNRREYKWYGAKGITVCEEWHNVETFLLWAEGQNVEGKTLERKDTSGNYEPGNCEFIPKSEQWRTQSSTLKVVVDGEELLLVDYCEGDPTLLRRMRRRIASGMPMDRVVMKTKLKPI